MKKILCALLQFCLIGWSADFTVDFSQQDGIIKKKLHGSGYMPNISHQGNFNGNKDFKELRFTFSRTHDQALANPSQRVVDTPFVFPLEHLDPSDPKNYYFKPTDYLLTNMISCGTLPYYRLGVSIEHSLETHHFNSVPPQDAEHYARILEGIIRHYNYGWADGFHMEIPFWEIWNEPNLGAQTWTGTLPEFNRFFAIVLKHLKTTFPNEKIGGPAFARFYGAKESEDELRELIRECKKLDVTPDFISFHHYGCEPAAALKYIDRVRGIVDEEGCQNAELHMTEWHYVKGYGKSRPPFTDPSGDGGIDSASFNIAMFAGFHDHPMDVACYYGAGQSGRAGRWGFYLDASTLNRNFYSMKMIGDFVHFSEQRVKATVCCDKNPQARNTRYILASVKPSESQGAILVTDYRGKSKKLTIDVKGVPEGAVWTVIRLDQLNNWKECEAVYHDHVLTLEKDKEGSAVWYVRYALPQTASSTEEK